MIFSKYQILTPDKIPQEVYNKCQNLKISGGILFETINDETFVYISLGERRTGGYSIKITKVELSEDEAIIYYKELAPTRGDMVIQVITYPEVYVKIPGKRAIKVSKE